MSKQLSKLDLQSQLNGLREQLRIYSLRAEATRKELIRIGLVTSALRDRLQDLAIEAPGVSSRLALDGLSFRASLVTSDLTDLIQRIL